MQKLLFVFFFIPVFCFSQHRLHVTLFGGFSNYQGDLQGKSFTFDQSNGAFGIGLRYAVTPNIAIRSAFNYGQVEGSDARNKASLRPRNLSFRSKIVEGNLLAEYTLFDLDTKRFSPYAFGGIALYHFNPYAYDTLGNKIFLRPLSTEGQGLTQYPDRKPYNLTQFALPFGGGIKLRVTENAVLGYELGLRKLFTDYLDDVKTTYVDPIALAQARGAKAVEMSYRGGELKGGDPAYPADGATRGGAKFKDWYYFSGITLTIGINTGNRNIFRGNKRKGSSTDCPVL